MTTPDPSADESFAAAFSPDPAVDAETSVVEPDDDADDDLEVADDTESLDPAPQDDAEPTDEVPEDDPDPDDDGYVPTLADYEAAVRALELEDPDTEDGDDGEPPSRREAKYRTELRATQVRLQAAENFIGDLQARVEVMQRAEIERIASARLADGSDLWAHGAHLDDLLNGDGDVDPAKVDQIIGELLNRRPHWGIPSPRRRGGLLSGASNYPEPRASGWIGAFGPGQRD